MTTPTYRGVVHGGMILLDKEMTLKEGAEVVVTPLVAARGAAAAVLAAMASSPPIAAEWVDELEQVIAEGQRLPASVDPFLEDQSGQERP